MLEADSVAGGYRHPEERAERSPFWHAIVRSTFGSHAIGGRLLHRLWAIERRPSEGGLGITGGFVQSVLGAYQVTLGASVSLALQLLDRLLELSRRHFRESCHLGLPRQGG